MKEEKNSILVLAIFMAFIATVFLPALVQSYYYPPTPEEQIDAIIHEVEKLVNKGVLDQGQGNELNTKIEAAQRMMLDKGNTTAACNLLQKFINQVQAYINAGTLPATKGKFLIGTANDVISQLRSGSFS